MTYYADLTPYSFLELEDASQQNALNVGWLSPEHEYPQGEIPDDAFWGLLRLASEAKVAQTRGYHACHFCLDHQLRVETLWGRWEYVLLGSAEIRVTGPSGLAYASPDLVVHYVLEHAYLPPDDFIAGAIAAGS